MQLTPQMRRMNLAIQRKHGHSLRDHILQLNQRNPRQPVTWIAQQLGVNQATLYDWLPRLDIELGGTILIDLAAERQRAVMAEVDELTARVDPDEMDEIGRRAAAGGER